MAGRQVNVQQEPLVSCVVIFYNTDAGYFIEAINSLLDQTYKNLEIILVDDGSDSKSTIDTAVSFVSKYPDRIKVVQHEARQNKGMSASRNLGVQHSVGEFITFLDSDDTLENHTLSLLVSLLYSHQSAQMVYGNIRVWFSWDADAKRSDEVTDFNYYRNVEYNQEIVVEPPVLLLLLLRQKISITGFIVRRRAFYAVGGFEDAFRGHYEDQIFCSKLCLRFPVVYCKACFYNYRQHDDSFIMSEYGSGFIDWRKGRKEFLYWLKGYLKRENISNFRVSYRLLIELIKLYCVGRRQLRMVRFAKRAWNLLFKR